MENLIATGCDDAYLKTWSAALNLTDMLNTGFAVKDTAREINAMIFAAMMRKTPEERLLMGFDMMATSRALVWSGLQNSSSEAERRKGFFRRYHGMECPF